jgi:hypothetical protein
MADQPQIVVIRRSGDDRRYLIEIPDGWVLVKRFDVA